MLAVPPTLLTMANKVIESGWPMTGYGTTRTSGDVGPECEKRSKADIEQTSSNDRV
jgi:hypothetical protein